MSSKSTSERVSSGTVTVLATCVTHDVPVITLSLSPDTTLLKHLLSKLVRRFTKLNSIVHDFQLHKCVGLGVLSSAASSESVGNTTLFLRESQFTANASSTLRTLMKIEQSKGSLKCVYWMTSQMSDPFLAALSAGGTITPVPGKPGYVDVSHGGGITVGTPSEDKMPVRDFKAKLRINVVTQAMFRGRNRLKDAVCFEDSELYSQCSAKCPYYDRGCVTPELLVHPRVAVNAMIVECDHPFRNLAAMVEEYFPRRYPFFANHEAWKLEGILGGFPLNGNHDILVGSVEWESYKDCLLSELFMTEGAGLGRIGFEDESVDSTSMKHGCSLPVSSRANGVLNVAVYLDRVNKPPKMVDRSTLQDVSSVETVELLSKDESKEEEKVPDYQTVDFRKNPEWSNPVCLEIAKVLDKLDLTQEYDILKSSEEKSDESSSALKSKSPPKVTLESVYSPDNCECLFRAMHPHVSLFTECDASHLQDHYHGPTQLCPYVDFELLGSDFLSLRESGKVAASTKKITPMMNGSRKMSLDSSFKSISSEGCQTWIEQSGFSLMTASVMDLMGLINYSQRSDLSKQADIVHLNAMMHPPRWLGYMFDMSGLPGCLVTSAHRTTSKLLEWQRLAAAFPSTVSLPNMGDDDSVLMDRDQHLIPEVFMEMEHNEFAIDELTRKVLMDRVNEVYDCQRHCHFGKPLMKHELLSLVLWVEGSMAIHDLRHSQCCLNDYKKWSVLDYCLLSSIDKLRRLEKGTFEVYSDLHCHSDRSHLRGSSYLRTFVSATSKSVARLFGSQSSSDLSMKSSDKLTMSGLKIKRDERLIMCDVSWVSRFPKEHEFIISRGIVHTMFDNWQLEQME